jgi:hypothetical protein
LLPDFWQLDALNIITSFSIFRNSFSYLKTQFLLSLSLSLSLIMDNWQILSKYLIIPQTWNATVLTFCHFAVATS